jgi:phospholipase B1, membrane-associated
MLYHKLYNLLDILQKYNPNLFGQSYGIGASEVWDVSYLNMAFGGSLAEGLPAQANQLVNTLKDHPEVSQLFLLIFFLFQIDVKNDWKLLNIFIGGNDLCISCLNPVHLKTLCIIQFLGPSKCCRFC